MVSKLWDIISGGQSPSAYWPWAVAYFPLIIRYRIAIIVAVDGCTKHPRQSNTNTQTELFILEPSL
jgi:hypothetical protein